MRGLLFISIVVFLFGSCKPEQKRVPQETFIDMLIDMHMIDAVTADYGLRNEIALFDSLTMEASILEKHGTTLESFEATLAWYSTQPKLLAEVYDEVFGRIDRMNEDIKSQVELFTGSKARTIWQIKKYKHYIGDTMKYPAPYYVPTEGIGTYLFDFKIRMLPQDKSTTPVLKVLFVKDKDNQVGTDSIVVVAVPIMKSNYTRDYQYLYELSDTSYKYVKIVVPDTPDRGAGKQKNIQISKLRVLMKNEEPAEKAPESAVSTEPSKN